MRALWTETEAEFHGEFANLERTWSWPKPAQPSIPVLLGAAGHERALEAIVGWADGWMPGGSITWIGDRLAELRRRWNAAGRAASGPTVWVTQDVVDDAKLGARLERLAALAVDQIVVAFDTVERDEILPVLDRYEKVISALAG